MKIRYTPELTGAPYYLSSSGLCGSPTIIDVGGDAFLLPTPNYTKVYDLVDLARKVLPNAKTVTMCGAGAGPYVQRNQCTEVRPLLISINLMRESHKFSFSGNLQCECSK